MNFDAADWPGAEDYVREFAKGRYDEEAYLTYIYPISEAHVSEDQDTLFVGRAGADSIEFAYRKNHPGIWAWHPIGCEWQMVAETIQKLEKTWCDRTLKV